MTGFSTDGEGDCIVLAEGTTALIGGLELIRAEQGTHRFPGRRSVEAALVETASYRVGRSEQGSELRAFFPLDGIPGPTGPGGGQSERGDGVDHVGQRRELDPVGGSAERIREQGAASVLVTVRQISPAGTTRPASRASKVSRTRNWRPPTWTGRRVSSRT